MLTEAACYRLLGLTRAATEDEVRRAYRELARVHHPDAGGDAERFKEISEAYAYLHQPTGKRAGATARPQEPTDFGGPEHRAAFDRWKRHAEAFHAAREGQPDPEEEAPSEPIEPPPIWTPAPVVQSHTPPPKPWFDRVREKVANWAVTRMRPQKGRDVSLKLEVDLETIINGGRHKVGITRQVRCPSRPATGCQITCACKGTGRVKVREKVRLYIPPGAHPGARLRLAGKGNESLDGQPDGDLYLLVEPPELSGFRREGPDLYGQITLDSDLAAEGGRVAVPVPLGSAPLSVPPGTTAGGRFRLRGQGLPRWGGGQRGDLYLTVEIV